MPSRLSIAKQAPADPANGVIRKPAAAPRNLDGPVLAGADWSFGDISLRGGSAMGFLQPKLQVGPVGDPLEREADAVAEQVTRSPARVQRNCSRCQEEDDEKQKVMRKETAAGAASLSTSPALAPASVHAVLRSPGQPLDSPARESFESRFGYGFGDVRIHTDGLAAQSAHDVRALAYTVGSHVAFGDGQYAPATSEGQKLLAHELTHVVQQRGPATPRVARQPKKPVTTTAPAPPVACNINCTDPQFTALAPAAREAQFNQQCPSGYPLSTTFFGQPIPAVSRAKLRSKLLEAEAKAKRAMCLNGQDPAAYTLDRKISTYATHSPAQDKAVDIDEQGQPYIMHEHNEADIDKDVSPVYDRIQFWAHYRKSVIPTAITTVAPGKGGGTARTWTNPATGAKNEAITTGELYDRLKTESDAMKDYFGLLLKTDADLGIELYAFLVFNTEPLTAVAKLGLPTDHTAADAAAFRQRIADDYRILGGSKAQLQSFAGQTIANASKAPKSLTGDRPFEKGAVAGATLQGGAPDPAANRRPELGFISLPKEVVVALTEVGLVWGAIDFFGESGDVMHFDCRNIC